MNPILVGFALYLLVVLGVGIWASRQTKSLADFALGDRKLGPWVLSLSERASSESAWLIVGLPGMAFVGGLFGIWIVVGIFCGSVLSWTVIAPRVCRLAIEHDAITLPDLLGKMLGSDWVRILSALIITFFFTFYVAAQFSGAGKVLNTTFGIDPFTGMVIGASMITLYTLLGGFYAVAWTDVVQAVLMFGTLVLLPIIGLIELTAMAPDTDVLQIGTLYGGKEGTQALIGVAGGLSWGLGYLGNPHIIARYMAAKSEEDIRYGLKIVILYSIPAFLGALTIGLVGKGLFDAGLFAALVDESGNFGDRERIMPAMATTLLNPWFAGIFISGAIAAMMSTADSQLLVTTTSIVKDFLARFRADEADLLNWSRWITLAVGGFAFVLAIFSDELVLKLVSYAWGGLGSSFGPVLVFALWWPRFNRHGAIAGLICGTTFTIVDLTNDVLTPRLTAFVIASIAAVLVTLMTKSSGSEHASR